MANITTTGTTGYPTVIDTSTTLTDGSSGDQIVANHPNGLAAAVIALETELGTDPAGSATDLKTRLRTALTDDGIVALASSSATVGALPLSRGGLGQVVASSTIANGNILIGGNSIWQVASLSATAGISILAGSGTLTFGTTPGGSGTLTAGNAYTLNPYAVSTASGATAHGLLVTPTFYKARLVNLSTEAGWTVGQEVDTLAVDNNAANVGWVTGGDGTNFYVSTLATLPYVASVTAPGAGVQITAAKWQLVVTPYKVN